MNNKSSKTSNTEAGSQDTNDDDELKSINQSSDIDKLIHEPNRLQIMVRLYNVEAVDMTYLKAKLGLTWGNLSSHISKLEEVGYLVVNKKLLGKKTHTTIQITPLGQEKFSEYIQIMKDIFTNL